MGENNPNIIQVIFKKLFGNGKSSAVTSTSNEVILKRVNMHILEIEDVLFHLNSAVMMPENPQGKSSAQGGGASEEQMKMSGLKALALVFKQFEFDPNMRMVITGHTDTSGTAEFNFILSKERSENILYLLFNTEEEDSRKKWAEVCYNRQKVEDYQQILAHYEKKLNCGCDPGNIDDKWGDKTKKATENFLEKLNFGSVKIKAAIYEIQTDSKKRWSKSIWELVYDLYSKELAEVLEITEAQLNGRRKNSINFVDKTQPILGCGESFPIDSKEKDNFRSQENRRVEILFFDKDESPEIKCPVDIKKVHTEEECPLWRKFYFVPLYIDPNDLTSIVIHLKFVYYDKIKFKQLPVPNGLTIKAFEDGHKNIPSETVYHDGIYFVKVKFKNKIKDPARTQFYFEIEGEDKYIYTKSDSDDPVIKTITKIEFDKLTFIEKQNYYDLPKFWSSRNYWTRYDGDINKGDKFEKVFKDIEKLKPLGDKLTQSEKPLVFSLDDIVITETTKSQILQDENQNGNLIPLDDNSRYTLFHIDYDTKEDVNGVQKNLRRMKIHNPESAQPVFTDQKFKENLITDVPLGTRSIYFCNDFYDVGYHRSNSTDTSFDYSKGHIAGARIAIKNDGEVHHSQLFQASNASDKTNGYGYNATFKFELHYLHNCSVLENKTLSYLLIYWSCRLRKDAAKGGTDADVTNHRRHGMKNAMERLNKDFMYEKSSGSEDIFIRPFHFMEAKNSTNGGAEKHDVKITDNNNGSWNSPSTASYRAACYQPEPGGWGGGDNATDLVSDTDGKNYIPMANHHEMGHATGCFDDYLYSHKIDDGGTDRSVFVPRFSPQHIIGGPYSCDVLARMKTNRSSRLRNYWKYICWVHDKSKAAAGAAPAGPMFSMLKGTRFKLTFEGDKNGIKFRHQFELEDSYKNISVHAFKDEDYELVTNAGTANELKSKVDLLIYKLADDQLSHFKNPGRLSAGYETTQVYYGILVVKIKYAVKFDGASWTFARKRRWLQLIDNEAGSMLNGKFFMECNNNDFKKLYLFFVPHFNDYSGAAPGDSNMNVVVSYANGTDLTKTNAKTVTMNRGSNAQQTGQVKRLIRCSLANSFGMANTGNLTKDNFPKVVEWTKSKLSNVNVECKTI
jgi:outer membrane protein OmpA-like peptidoglycan-associated protein